MILLKDDVVNMGREDSVECLIHVRENVAREIVGWVDCHKVACCLDVQCCVDVDRYGWEGLLICPVCLVGGRWIVCVWRCDSGIGCRFVLTLWRNR